MTRVVADLAAARRREIFRSGGQPPSARFLREGVAAFVRLHEAQKRLAVESFLYWAAEFLWPEQRDASTVIYSLPSPDDVLLVLGFESDNEARALMLPWLEAWRALIDRDHTPGPEILDILRRVAGVRA